MDYSQEKVFWSEVSLEAGHTVVAMQHQLILPS